MSRPQRPEPFAAERELAHQLDESRIVDVVPDRASQRSDETLGSLRPVLVERLLLRVQEQRAQAVLARP